MEIILKFIKNKNYICFLISLSMIFSGLFWNIVYSQSILSDYPSNQTHQSYSITDALPAGVSASKTENIHSSCLFRFKNSGNSFRGFGGMAAIAACVFNNRFYTSFSSMASVNTLPYLHSHIMVLNYIHQKDGKK